MDEQMIVKKTEQYVRKKFEGEGSGHDWWHIHRVRKIAVAIGKKEDCNLFVVQLGALLHDIADFKFHHGDETISPKVAREWLDSLKVEKEIINKVCEIVTHISYKGAKVANKMESIEGKVVQDADRLDAIGALGIARAFAYGGHAGREMYNPEKVPHLHSDAEAYKKNNSPTINHFYEKLLLLKDRMNTQTGKQMALQRHEYMEKFLEQFYSEWDGKV